MKAQLIMFAVKFIMGAIALGLGIWYLSSSLGGAALTYSSMGNFMNAVGVENGDIASANGCFLCGYVNNLFSVIGNATEMFWNAIVQNLWIVMVIGFGVFVFIHTGEYLFAAAKTTTKLDTSAKKLELKAWFDKIWHLGVRVLIVGALMGMLGMGGTAALRTVTTVTITPVLFIGSELSMAATGVTDVATCNAFPESAQSDDILNPVVRPFMCVMGNLNTVMLAGAAGGFALMNYAWMGLGGGAFTWLAGLALVLMFLVIGFDLFFQVLSVIFQLIFVIIFMPIFLAAAAFEKVWKAAQGLMDKAIKMVTNAAIRILAITLKILILYATVSFAADEYFPAPADGYTAILPPLMGRTVQNPDAQTMSVMKVFETCERVALVDGEMDSDKFKNCFITEREKIEQRYPHAFDFMDDGMEFLLLMIGIFALYYYIVSPRVDALLPKDADNIFDLSGNIKKLGASIWSIPQQIASAITRAMGT